MNFLSPPAKKTDTFDASRRGFLLGVAASAVVAAPAFALLKFTDPERSTRQVSAGPQTGRLTTLRARPEITQRANFTSRTLDYAPFYGDRVLVPNGEAWESVPFTSGPDDQVGLSMSGGAKWLRNTSRDVFVTLIGGTATLATGPAWPGESEAARGLVRRNGIWVNDRPMALDLSESGQVHVLQNRAAWVGSINPEDDGLLAARFSYGQSRRCDFWNLYNQREILLSVGQPPVNGKAVRWMPDTQYPEFKAFNDNPANSGKYFTGLPQNIDIKWFQRCFVDSLNYGFTGVFWAICRDAVSNPVGFWGGFSSDTETTAAGYTGLAYFTDNDSVGAHDAIMGTAKANATGSTLWGAHPPWPRGFGATAHLMNIRYLG